MTEPSLPGPLSHLLEHAMRRHGWLGRMYGARRWLLAGSLSPACAAPVSVVAIRRHVRPESPCGLFDDLRQDGLAFQRILVDIPQDDDMGAARLPDGHADIHLVIADAAPWYTAFNLGALCASAERIVFLHGAARAHPGLLAAYDEAFRTHPETLTARGVLYVPGLEDCACQVTGSFALREDTALWPTDLDENMAVRAETFFALGGFDESLIGGYGALDFSIRLFGRVPEFACQRHVPQARIALEAPEHLGLPLEPYLMQRQRAWLQLNDSLKRYLELYGKFWLEHTKEVRP